MNTPPVTIKSVKVVAQTPRTTEIRVVCNYVGAEYTARTEISEGRSVPNTVLEGYTVPPAEEFVIALHEALDTYDEGRLVSKEMERICG
jgi:hypothetical protein